MAFKDELLARSKDLVTALWEPRDGKAVPEPEAVALKDGAVDIEGAVLYADLANSTGLVTNCNREFAAKATRVFLYVASQICKKSGGKIRSFDGDRVMAVFTGTSAVRLASAAAFKIVRARGDVMIPAITARYGKWNPNAGEPWSLEYGVGLDTSSITVIKAGAIGDNDLVWLGPAANHAAKLSALRQSPYRIFCTPAFYNETPFKKNIEGTATWSEYAGGSYYRSSASLELDA